MCRFGLERSIYTEADWTREGARFGTAQRDRSSTRTATSSGGTSAPHLLRRSRSMTPRAGPSLPNARARARGRSSNARVSERWIGDRILGWRGVGSLDPTVERGPKTRGYVLGQLIEISRDDSPVNRIVTPTA